MPPEIIAVQMAGGVVAGISRVENSPWQRSARISGVLIE